MTRLHPRRHEEPHLRPKGVEQYSRMGVEHLRAI